MDFDHKERVLRIAKNRHESATTVLKDKVAALKVAQDEYTAQQLAVVETQAFLDYANALPGGSRREFL